MAPLLAWYHARLQKTKLGTVLATTHFCILSLLLGGIVISLYMPLFSMIAKLAG